jgi:hypothetical protein
MLGLFAAQSDLVWRYFLKQAEENQDLSDFLDLRRSKEEQALQQMLRENGIISNKESVLQIYNMLKEGDTSQGNPLTMMMSRNLRIFAKWNILYRKQIKKDLQEWKAN